MKRKKIIVPIAGGLVALLGAGAAYGTRPTGENPVTVVFALGLIVCLLGMLAVCLAFLPERRATDTRTLTMAAMFAALCYIGFAFFQVKIPVGDSATSFHLGNVFCVLAALTIGPVWGGLAGAVGMTIGDLFDPVYITSAPKTFLLKLGIGLVTGLLAHRVFGIGREERREVPLTVAVFLSCTGGMLFNLVADPIVGYFYKLYLLGIPQDAATILAKLSALTTGVNALIAVIAAGLFYLALRPALKKADLLPRM